jgi:amino acid adenylation domain-containing protein
MLRRRLSGRRGRGTAQRTQISPVSRDGRLELSSGQRQLWFLHRLDPTSHEYLMPRAWDIRGQLDVEALQLAATRLVARHEILRTRYQLLGDEPVQVIDPVSGPVMAVTDLGTTDDPPRRAQELLERAAAIPIDIELRWPIRMRLLRLADDHHVLIVVFHHIVCDAWSVELFASELSTLYAAFAAGERSSPLPPLDIQYADYAAWERSQSEEHERHLEYWTRQLAGLTSLDLPTDRQRPATRDWAGDTHSFDFPRHLADGLRQVARRFDSPLYPVLLAAFQALLSEYTTATDIPVGTVVSGRTLPELQRLIGYGVNTLIIRGRWEGDPTIAELVGRAKAATAEAFDHQNVPFAKLVDRLEPERDLSRTQLFQVVFTLQASGADALALPGLDVAVMELASKVARFDLTMLVDESPDGALRGNLEYATSLFDRSTVERIAAGYLRLLELVVENPDRNLSDCDLTGASERDVLLRDWSKPAEPRPRRRVHEVFQERVARAPDATAVVCGEARLTYAELDARANQLARTLLDRGAGPGALVGVCLDRGLDLVVCLLAVVKSGSAYLPLDPAQPPDRLGFILDDSGAQLVVTDAGQAEVLGKRYRGTLLSLGDEADPTRPASTANPGVPGCPDDPMYVIYTSGSTGRPKGTVVSHGNVLRLFTTTEPWFGFSASDVWTLFHSYAFDFSVWELWGALLYGGTLVVVPRMVSRSPDEFLDLLVAHQVTVLNQTPSAFGGLVALAVDGDARLERLALRVVVFGGERLELAELRGWVDRMGLDAPELVNMYGITETTVHVTYHRLVAADFAAGGSPIGVPLPDLRVCLLDRWGRLSPIGVPGEICVGGPGVAQGYLGRPALTAERFVPDPFGPPGVRAGRSGDRRGRAGARLYRSGDLARRRADGTLEFLGRIDDQVKIRGFRVELGEIEAALTGHPAIRQATVQLRRPAAAPDAPAPVAPVAPSLVGYLVLEPGAPAIPPSQLRAHLATSLPEYMIPSAFVPLDRLPLTANGKLDRAALPEPERAATGVAGGYLAPRDATERRMCQIWAETLGLEKVGVDDGFFDVGGDSIRAVALVGKLRASGWDLSVRDVFEHRTVAALASVVSGRTAGTTDQVYVAPFELISAEDRAKVPGGVVDAYPMSRVQIGMVVEMTLDRKRNFYHNCTSYRMKDDQPFSLDALRQAAELLVERHEILRTAFDLIRFSVPMQLVHATAQIEVTEYDATDVGEAGIRPLLGSFGAAERAKPFRNLRKPCLLRLAAHVSDERVWWLSVVEHHAILEGWSHHSLLMELLACYRALRSGEDPTPVRRPQLRYADFIAAELRSLRSEADRAYWQSIISDYPKFALPIGLGDPDGAPLSKHVSVAAFADLEEGLRALAARAGTPLKSVLLAAHLKVLSELTDLPDFYTGVVVHGRPEVVGAELVYGMYLNSLPFAHTGGAATWMELVQRVFERETQLWAHRNFPMPAIQRELGDGTRLVDTMFIYMDFHQIDFQLVDYTAGIDDSPNEFPLSVHAQLGGFFLAADTRVFSRDHTDRLAKRYRGVLESMAADPGGDA